MFQTTSFDLNTSLDFDGKHNISEYLDKKVVQNKSKPKSDFDADFANFLSSLNAPRKPLSVIQPETNFLLNNSNSTSTVNTARKRNEESFFALPKPQPPKQEYKGPAGMMDEVFDMLEDEDSNFIIAENFESTLHHVNNRLISLGFKNPIRIKSDAQPDHINVLTVIYKLLQMKQRDLEIKDKLHERISRIQCDNQSLSENTKRLKEEGGNRKREAELAHLNLENFKKDAKREQKRLQTENEKLNIKVRDLQQKIVQFEHSMQRKEREMDKLKEKLQKLVMDKGLGGGKMKIEVINEIPRNNKIVLRHGQERNETALYQNVVGAFEDEKQELVQENLALKESYKKLNAEVNQLRNIVFSRHGIKEFETNSEINEDIFNLPFGYSQNDIEETLQQKIDEIGMVTKQHKSNLNSLEKELKIIHDSLHMLPEMEASDALDRLEEIRIKIREYQKVISQQDTLLQLGVAKQFHSHLNVDQSYLPTANIVHTSFRSNSFPSMDTTAEEEKQLVQKQKKNLDIERQELERLAIQLDQEKVKLEKERRHMEQFKSVDLNHQVDFDEDFMHDEDNNIPNSIPSVLEQSFDFGAPSNNSFIYQRTSNSNNNNTSFHF